MARPEKHTCNSCNGTRKCDNCDGKGKVRDFIKAALSLGGVSWSDCSPCDGTGKCQSCEGKGFYWSDK
jgi:DnaJ-class molecular chaperone